MKRYIYVIATVLFCCGAMISCKKDLKTYDGASGIYFLHSMVSLNNIASNDSLVVSFAYAKTTTKDSLVLVPVRITGAPANKDREFKMTIAPSSTAIAGTHYEILTKTLLIPANQTTAIIVVNLKRTLDMLENTFMVRFNLEENDNFKMPMKDVVVNTATGKKKSYITYSIWVSDILKKPKAWFDHYMGTFSRKKLFLLAEVAGIENIGDLDNTSITTIPKTIYYGTFLQRYLNEMKAGGKTIYEEDGVTEMIMGPGVQ